MNNKNEDINSYYTAAAFIFLFIGPLVIYKPAYDYTIIKNITGYLFCILLSAAFIIRKKNFAFNRLTFFPFLFFAVWTLLSAVKAPFGHGAAKQLEEYLLYFLIFICAANVKVEKKWVYFWLGAGFTASVIAIGQFFGRLKYPVSTFGNPNFFAGHIMMLIVIAAAVFFASAVKNKERLALAAFLVVSSAAVLITKSRAAVFAVAFGVSTVLFLIHGQESFALKKWGGYIFMAAAALIFFPRIQYWVHTNVRIYLWQGAFEMIKGSPAAGWGLGNFVFFYPYFRVKEYFLQPEATATTTHVHNEYLHIWTETGIIGLFLFLLLAGAVIFHLVKTAKKGGGEDILFLGIAGGIAAVLADNIFSTNLRNPSTAMYFWFLMGLSSGRLVKKAIDVDISKILWYTICFASLVMCVFTSFYRILPEVYLKRGIWAGEKKEVREAVDNYLIVSSINPYNYISRYKLAYIYGETGQLEEAKKVYLEIQNNIFPNFAKINANLGTIYLRMGLHEKALYYYKRAEWFNPYDIDVLCSTASIYFQSYDNIQKGLEYLNKVLAIDPGNGYANRIIGMLDEEGGI